MRSLSKNRPQQLMFGSKVWPMRGCFAIQHRLEEAASPSDREIDANQKHVMSNHDKISLSNNSMPYFAAA
jgi:hypothetical protein